MWGLVVIGCSRCIGVCDFFDWRFDYFVDGEESLLFILELFEEGFKVSEEREFSLFLRRNDLESVEENLEGF